MPHLLADPSIRARCFEARRCLKAVGRRWCRSAPAGYAWRGRPGRQYLVADEYARAVAGEIVQRKERGESWYSITASIWRRDGGDWSVGRTRNLFSAAVSGRLTAYDQLLGTGCESAKKEVREHAAKRRRRALSKKALFLFEVLFAAFRHPKR